MKKILLKAAAFIAASSIAVTSCFTCSVFGDTSPIDPDVIAQVAKDKNNNNAGVIVSNDSTAAADTSSTAFQWDQKTMQSAYNSYAATDWDEFDFEGASTLSRSVTADVRDDVKNCESIVNKYTTYYGISSYEPLMLALMQASLGDDRKALDGSVYDKNPYNISAEIFAKCKVDPSKETDTEKLFEMSVKCACIIMKECIKGHPEADYANTDDLKTLVTDFEAQNKSNVSSLPDKTVALLKIMGGTAGGMDANGVMNVPYFNQSLGYYQNGQWTNQDWAAATFSNGSTISSSGCGFCSTAMAISYCTGNIVSPTEFMNNGQYVPGAGAEHTVGIVTAQSYGVSAHQVTSWDDVVSELKSGHPVMAIMKGPSMWTGGGHYILLIGYTKDGKVAVNDCGHAEHTYCINGGECYDPSQITSCVNSSDIIYTAFGD